MNMNNGAIAEVTKRTKTTPITIIIIFPSGGLDGVKTTGRELDSICV
jgi:hypothetical protein